MSVAPLLDTHVWLGWMDHDERLGAATLDGLAALPPNQRPYLSAISLWEAAMLVELGRISLARPLHEWLADATHPGVVRLVPITVAIAAGVASLPPTFHRDPADRIIVASCQVLKAPIVTRDRLITRSRLVSQWRPEPL